ncbi:unnamed protein product [Aureobasidium mustum]|uniref:Uncharacterized protein n=1 Tax=Aureobasidium mustum TaxID=2773714 RepID=A0A9N8PJB0_9PEZI|nr:unnamed protein product [Aureobasidium mustum]
MSVSQPGMIDEYPRISPITSWLSANMPARYWKLLWLFRGSAVHPTTVVRKLVFCPEALTLPKPLPTPRALRNDEELVWKRYDGIHALRYIRRFRDHDKPLHSVYRMCEFICSDEEDQLVTETDYFLARTNWRLKDIADPDEDNPERRALLAATIECLVDTFNEKHDLGVTRDDAVIPRQACPRWVRKVPAVSFLDLVKEEDETTAQSAGQNDPIWPSDPAFTIQQDNGHGVTSIEFTGSDVSDKLKPVFALQVCTPAGGQGTCLDSGSNKPLVDTLPLH